MTGGVTRLIRDTTQETVDMSLTVGMDMEERLLHSLASQTLEARMLHGTLPSEARPTT